MRWTTGSRRTLRSWLAIVGASIGAGLIAWVGFVGINLLFGDDAGWRSAGVSAAGVALVLFMVGLGSRRGWALSGRRTDDR